MKSQVVLLTALLQDAGDQFGFNPKRDIATVTKRVEHEGVQFVEITLPSLDDLLLEGLSRGRLPDFSGWSTGKAKYPLFLQSLWKRVFSASGDILSSPDELAILFIRQITRCFKKIKAVCNPRYTENAKSDFIRTDDQLSRVDPGDGRLASIRQIARILFNKVIRETVTSPGPFKHGPGAVAEGTDSVSRYSFPVLSERVYNRYGLDPFRATWQDMLREPVISDIPARLVAVPKTATKPRLISIEPSYNQFLQQGYHTKLKEELDKTAFFGYSSQAPNQELARRGSLDGSFATIDLSEASDRVIWSLVQKIFSFDRDFVSILRATRSECVDIDGHGLIKLNKFASMGSAFTFPVEVMYFGSIVVNAIVEYEGISRDRKSILDLLNSLEIRVYGDDIIVPSKYYPIVCEHLSTMGLKVNTSKSFNSGQFRESCGADWYNGINVTPIYLRQHIASTQRDASAIVSSVSFHNQLFDKQLWPNTCSSIVSLLRKTGLKIPKRSSIYSDAAGLAFSTSEETESSRFNRSIQTLQQRCPIPVYTRKRVSADDHAVLFKSLYEGFNEDRDHLTHHGRPVSAKLKYGWISLL